MKVTLMGAAAVPLDKPWRAGRLGVAAFLQDPRSLEIYAATAKMP